MSEAEIIEMLKDLSANTFQAGVEIYEHFETKDEGIADEFVNSAKLIAELADAMEKTA